MDSKAEQIFVGWDRSWLLWVHTVLWSIAALLSGILFVGLLIPLLIQLAEGSYQWANSIRSGVGSSRLRKEYSSYNLYLIYLAIGDFAFSLLAIYASVRWNYVPSVEEGPIFNYFAATYSLANFSINAAMCYQIKVLLQTSQRRRKYSQPSLTRVNLQGTVAYILQATFNTGCLFRSGYLISHVVYYFLMLVLIFYIFYATFVVWYRDYIPPLNGKSACARAARELAFYFYRISGTFIFIWIPGTAFQLAARAAGKAWCQQLVGLLVAIQPIVAFFISLKKSDVRRYIVDLVTMSYAFGDWRCQCNCFGRKEEDVVVESVTPKKSISTILGFDISIEEEEDSDSEDDGGLDGDDESVADVVSGGETNINASPVGDLESGKHPYTSRRNEDRRKMVLMTGKAMAVDDSRDTTARTTGSEDPEDIDDK